MPAQMDKFDGVLLSIAQVRRLLPWVIKPTIILICFSKECDGGVQEMLDVIFSFLARKTDFYTGGGEDAAEKLVITRLQMHIFLIIALMTR